jgi:hypothetical protein
MNRCTGRGHGRADTALLIVVGVVVVVVATKDARMWPQDRRRCGRTLSEG